MTMGCPIQSAILPSSGYQSTISVSSATEKKKLWILFGSCEELEWPAIDEISTRSVIFFFSFCKPCVKNAFLPKETSCKGKVKLSYNFIKIGHSILYFLHPPSIQSHPTHWCLIHSRVSLGERLSTNRGTWSKAWHSGRCCLFTLQMLSNSFISMTTGTFADTQSLPMGETCCHLLAVSKEIRSSGKLVFLGQADSVAQTIRLLFCIGLFAVWRSSGSKLPSAILGTHIWPLLQGFIANTCPLGASATSPIVYCLINRLIKALQQSQ